MRFVKWRWRKNRREYSNESFCLLLLLCDCCFRLFLFCFKMTWRSSKKKINCITVKHKLHTCTHIRSDSKLSLYSVCPIKCTVALSAMLCFLNVKHSKLIGNSFVIIFSVLWFRLCVHSFVYSLFSFVYSIARNIT